MVLFHCDSAFSSVQVCWVRAFSFEKMLRASGFILWYFGEGIMVREERIDGYKYEPSSVGEYLSVGMLSYVYSELTWSVRGTLVTNIRPLSSR